MRFTTNQIFILKSLAHGPIPARVLRLWNQVPLRGLYVRGFFTFNGRHDACITPEGWNAYKATTHVLVRKNKEAPLFKANYNYRKEMRA